MGEPDQVMIGLHSEMIRTPVERDQRIGGNTEEVECARIGHRLSVGDAVRSGSGAACAQVGCEHTSLFMRLSNVPIVNVKAELMPRFCARKALWTLTPLVALVLTSMAALAAEAIKLTIKDQRFVPTDMSVPAGERFRIEVENQDATPAEFDSADLRVEKIVVDVA